MLPPSRTPPTSGELGAVEHRTVRLPCAHVPSMEVSPMKKPVSGDRSKASRLVTTYIDELGDWRTATLARLREVIRSAEPGIVEAWKWDHPVWEAGGIVCVAGAFKGYVKLTFPKGASLKDPRRLFNAGLGGKAWRAIDIRQGDKIDAAGLKALIRDAAALNAIPKRK